MARSAVGSSVARSGGSIIVRAAMLVMVLELASCANCMTYCGEATVVFDSLAASAVCSADAVSALGDWSGDAVG